MRDTHMFHPFTNGSGRRRFHHPAHGSPALECVGGLRAMTRAQPFRSPRRTDQRARPRPDPDQSFHSAATRGSGR
jgi:hypothetical protein